MPLHSKSHQYRSISNYIIFVVPLRSTFVKQSMLMYYVITCYATTIYEILRTINLLQLILLSRLVVGISFMMVSLHTVLEAQVTLSALEREVVRMYTSVLLQESFFGIAVGTMFALVFFWSNEPLCALVGPVATYTHTYNLRRKKLYNLCLFWTWHCRFK